MEPSCLACDIPCMRMLSPFAGTLSSTDYAPSPLRTVLGVLGQQSTQRLILAAVSIAAVLTVGVAALSLTPGPTASFERVATARSAQQSLNIANNGLTHIQGAQVLSISSGTLVALSAWDSGVFRWSVVLSGDTRVVLPGGEEASLSAIAPGDFITISGHLAGQSDTVQIQAESIRLIASKSESAPIVQLKNLGE